MNFKSNPIYVQEKWEHQRHCDSGFITIGSIFGGFRKVKCKYCARIEKAIAEKEAKLKAQKEFHGQDKRYS